MRSRSDLASRCWQGQNRGGPPRLSDCWLSEPSGINLSATPFLVKPVVKAGAFFGYSGQGTGGAAYYLWKYYHWLNATFKKKGYCGAVKVYRNESYKSIEKTFRDLSKEAFSVTNAK